MNKTETKGIRFTPEQLKKVEKRAKQLGLNASSYIHFLIAKDLEEKK